MFLVMYAGIEVLPAELFEAARSTERRWERSGTPCLSSRHHAGRRPHPRDGRVQELDIIYVLTGGGPEPRPRPSRCSATGRLRARPHGAANALGIITLGLVAVLCYLLMRAILRPGRSGGAA
jgi:ABC-type sugar transport system permease subunit